MIAANIVTIIRSRDCMNTRLPILEGWCSKLEMLAAAMAMRAGMTEKYLI